MIIQHHPDEATLMSYAAGTLSEALSVVVASHLELCPHCRARARELEALGAVLLDDVAPEDMSDASLAVFWQKLDALDDKVLRIHPERAAKEMTGTASGLSGPLAKLLGRPLAEVRWKRLAPGIRYHRLPLSDPSRGDLRLLKIAPGRTLPEHGHGGSEITLILSGSYHDRFGRFGPGDVADLDAEVEHQPIVDPEQECICLVASEHPARFKGLLSRLLQPLVGM
ncbi:MAG: ChrR family anti-sigma-E factor [Methyloligellaceae bacterium]